MQTLADVSQGRDNHFNLIRLVAAAAVLVSHSYPLTMGMGAAEPLEGLTGHSLGACAVFVFFGISGYMIAGSFDRRRDLAGFLAARVARIVPGLAVALLVTVAVLGPIATTLPLGGYLTELHTWTYVPRNLSLRFLQYELPGVFDGNIYPDAINGSLWTLYWEVCCYALVVMTGLLGLLKPHRFAIFLIAFIAIEATLVLSDHTPSFVRLSPPFVAGMAFYVYRNRLPLTVPSLLAVIGIAAAMRFTPLWLLAYGFALAYVALWLGHARAPALLRYNRVGDYSYGTYIYAFPVQQTLAWTWPGISAFQMIAVALPITLTLAILSWNLIEGPALDRRDHLAEWLRRLFTRMTALVSAGHAQARP